jgi:hypothetical protein
MSWTRRRPFRGGIGVPGGWKDQSKPCTPRPEGQSNERSIRGAEARASFSAYMETQEHTSCGFREVGAGPIGVLSAAPSRMQRAVRLRFRAPRRTDPAKLGGQAYRKARWSSARRGPPTPAGLALQPKHSLAVHEPIVPRQTDDVGQRALGVHGGMIDDAGTSMHVCLRM